MEIRVGRATAAPLVPSTRETLRCRRSLTPGQGLRAKLFGTAQLSGKSYVSNFTLDVENLLFVRGRLDIIRSRASRRIQRLSPSRIFAGSKSTRTTS